MVRKVWNELRCGGSSGMWWKVVTCGGIFWNVWECFRMWRIVLKCIGMFWCWHVLECSGVW